MKFPLYTTIPPKSDFRPFIDNWEKSGFKVTSINNPEEAATLRAAGVNVLEVASRDKKLKISEIMHAIAATGERFAGFINADCRFAFEIDVNALRSELKNSLIMADRFDVTEELIATKSLCWGFDAFFFDTAQLASIPRSAVYRIGVPWWDYWFPMFMRRAGLTTKRFKCPILYHIDHEKNWDNDVLNQMATIFQAEFPEIIAIENGWSNGRHCYEELMRSQVISAPGIDPIREGAFASINALAREIEGLQNPNDYNRLKIEPPRRKIDGNADKMKFLITTPVMNGERFIDETILSIVSQSGPFTIRYHVQDGGSTDDTLAILEGWKARLSSGFPILCDGIEFSYSSAPDHGIYDAIKRGFGAFANDSSVIMSWLNADDRFEPGAFATTAQIFQDHGDIHWLTGRNCMIDEAGTKLVDLPYSYPREAIAAGIFEGLAVPKFVQQEGTFWRSGLWHKAGGIDTRFKLAGDFDLWRRFAAHSDLVNVDVTTGCFRVRSGQASSNLTKYHAEIEALSPRDPARLQQASMRLDQLPYRNVIRDGNWVCQRHNTRPEPASEFDRSWESRLRCTGFGSFALTLPGSR